MKKLGLISGMIVEEASLLLSLSVNTKAGAKDEKAIKELKTSSSPPPAPTR